jgi:hypothetical protein
MNKKEVSMFLTAVTGRLLCAEWADFRKWAEERAGKSLWTYEFAASFSSKGTSSDIVDTITDAEWHEIADFFVELEEEEKEKTTIIRFNKKEHKVTIAQTVEDLKAHDNMTRIYNVTHIKNYGFVSNLFNGNEVIAYVSNVMEVIEE